MATANKDVSSTGKNDTETTMEGGPGAGTRANSPPQPSAALPSPQQRPHELSNKAFEIVSFCRIKSGKYLGSRFMVY